MQMTTATMLEVRLLEFTRRITQYQNGNHSVRQRIRAFLHRVDFSNACARLVSFFSRFARGQRWMDADEDIGVDSDSDADPSSGDDHEVKKKSIGTRT
mmetsp:Transcript_20615/g.37251  ORF Transcript_20615/g.37251 Transcript_20615/m.37251 type:complete len:98 (-) Transcript_20615:942-1235(-)